MIQFLNLKKINSQYRSELVEACTNVIDSGWYIQGGECKNFEKNFAKYWLEFNFLYILTKD